MKLLSVIVPTYNEEANVELLYEAVNQTLQQISDRYQWEFVFTDNCSADRTFELLERLAARDPRVRVYRFTRNFGFQRSILTGYRLARGDAAVQIDCDLQDPPELILDFLSLWERGYKVVYGVRRSRPESAFLCVARRSFYRIIAWLSDDKLPVDAGDFRLVDRCILDLLHLYRDENPYLRGYIASLGYRQIGVTYDRRKRERGETSFRLSGLVNLALDGIVSHSILPLRLASFVGVSLAGLATLAILVYLVAWLVSDQSWPAGFATISFLVLVSLAINAVFLGIIGEYLARIYRQVKPQPLTIVERFVDRTPSGGGKDRATQAIADIVFPLEDSGDPRQAKGMSDGL
jgi:glycosyltransferase involved in cell wall biosynthesis